MREKSRKNQAPANGGHDDCEVDNFDSRVQWCFEFFDAHREHESGGRRRNYHKAGVTQNLAFNVKMKE